MRNRQLKAGALSLGLFVATLTGCATMGLRSAVDMSVEVADGTPKRALVYIDEEFIGTLDYVAQRGVRVPEGQHRVSVEKTGYYPFDTLIESKRDPINLKVELVRLPD